MADIEAFGDVAGSHSAPSNADTGEYSRRALILKLRKLRPEREVIVWHIFSCLVF